MSASAAAWLLRTPAGQRLAIGERELVQILPNAPTSFQLPRTPAHCRSLALWNSNVVPIVDLDRLAGVPSAADLDGIHVVVGFSGARGSGHAALPVTGIPERTSVGIDEGCSPGEVPDAWRPLAHAAFSRGGEVVAVLDLPRILS